MAIENLPRPWVLAALTGLKVTDLALPPEDRRPERPTQPPRPQPRRRRPRDAVKGRYPATVIEGRFG